MPLIAKDAELEKPVYLWSDLFEESSQITFRG